MYPKFLALLLLAFKIAHTECLTSSRLPKLLVPCYNGNFTMENKPPLTIKLLVELLRKVEMNKKSNANLRILTNTLLHKIKFDGILKADRGMRDNEALLYRARGHEFHKYKLVTDYIVTGPSTLSIDESLTQNEICYLHHMLSITIEKLYRGDEEKSCGFNFSNTPVELSMQNLKLSVCPLMKGNMFTKWGTVTPGHLVFGLNAALENMQPSFDTILSVMNKTSAKIGKNKAESLWISTIAGDLADALLNRADTDLELGTSGFWNDSSLPLIYFLSDYSSDMTESILLGGVDGLILGNHLKTWEQRLMTIRFSQIIDMYYSNRGISYNSTIKASNRKLLFSEILKKTNLTHQVIGTAVLLEQIANYERYLNENEINELATLAVDKFEDVADDITNRYDSVEFIDEPKMRSSLEIILILDGSFDYSTSKKIIYSLAETTDVSIYGSQLGIINGDNGRWMSNITGQVFDIFRNIENSKNSWPSKLSLGLSFQTILEYYQNIIRKGCVEGTQKPLGRSIVILSNKAKPNNSDLESYKQAVSSLKNSFPDINILYALTPDNQGFFYDLPNRYLNDTFLNISENIDLSTSSIGKILQRIPGQIVNIHCNDSNSKTEDYLTPGIERFYEIHEEYYRKYNFQLTFLGSNYGNITVCYTSFRDSSKEICKRITEDHSVKIKSTDLCTEDLKCTLKFVLVAQNSTFSCAESDCRYPDQVRLDITWMKSGATVLQAESYYFITFFYFIHILSCRL